MSQQSRLFYGWVIVGIALVMMAVGYALRNTFSVFYPVLVEDFGWDRGNTALMFSINVLVYGITAPIAGGLIDRFSPRLVFPVGVFLMGGAIALCSLATQQWHFYLLYGVVAACGLSMCGSTPLAALVSRWFVRRRALAFGIFNMGFGISLLASPAAQSLITDLGRRQAYASIGLAAIAIVVPLVVLFMRRSPEEKGTVPDGDVSPGRQQTVPLKGVETPWMRVDWTLRRALRTRQFWLLFLTALCLLGLAQQVIITHSVYLFQDRGFAPQPAANSFSFYGIGITIGYLFANLSDRIGRERVLVPGCLLSAAGTSLLFLVDGPAHIGLACTSMFLCGLGMGGAVTTFFATVADLFQGRNYGAIQGLMTFGFSIGGAFSPWFAGYLHDMTDSYVAAVALVVTGLTTAGLLVMLSAPRRLRPVAGMVARGGRQGEATP
jgi:MFS family permease